MATPNFGSDVRTSIRIRGERSEKSGCVVVNVELLTHLKVDRNFVTIRIPLSKSNATASFSAIGHWSPRRQLLNVSLLLILWTFRADHKEQRHMLSHRVITLSGSSVHRVFPREIVDIDEKNTQTSLVILSYHTGVVPFLKIRSSKGCFLRLPICFNDNRVGGRFDQRTKTTASIRRTQM